MPPRTVLILGGTTQANILAGAMRDGGVAEPLLSLAGRTATPVLPAGVASRRGGFGGVAGLESFLRQHGVAAVVDATHPFAAQMSAHAAEACRLAAVPLVTFTRPPWAAAPGDRWTSVPDLQAAAVAIGAVPKRVFLTSGRLGLAAFKAAPQHLYWVRTVDPVPPAEAPPHTRFLLGRGPFDEASERALMREAVIEVLVSKNSGGSAGKITAARALQLPVILVERPAASGDAPVFTALADVERWLAAHLAPPPP